MSAKPDYVVNTLTRPTGATASGGYVINLTSSTTPMALSQPKDPTLAQFTFFVSRRREDGRERFRLHMGYFETQQAAEEMLSVVREVYPSAWAGEAPGKKLRPTNPAAAAPAPAPAAAPRAAPLPRRKPKAAAPAAIPAAAAPAQPVAAKPAAPEREAPRHLRRIRLRRRRHRPSSSNPTPSHSSSAPTTPTSSPSIRRSCIRPLPSR